MYGTMNLKCNSAIFTDFVKVITSLQSRVSHIFLLEDCSWHQKITMDPYILFHINIEYPDDKGKAIPLQA